MFNQSAVPTYNDVTYPLVKTMLKLKRKLNLE